MQAPFSRASIRAGHDRDGGRDGAICMRLLNGSCQCQTVTFQIAGRITDAMYCHCSICRKLHGTAFRARAIVKASDFRFLSGEDILTFYQSSPGVERGFCRICGSPILTRFMRNPAHLGVPLGPLDDDPGIRATRHVHVASKAPWFTIGDDLEQFAEGAVIRRDDRR